MNTLSVKVTRKVEEAEGIASFELTSASGTPLPPFSAGSHIDVHVRDGIVRQYSLCNDPTEQHRYLIAVLRDPSSRGGSEAMHDEVAEGAILQISEPRNHFPLSPSARTLLLAGGIGVTPLLCMAERLAQIGATFTMHYCTRSSQRTAFRERIAQSQFADRVDFHFDDGPADQKLDLSNVLGAPTSDVNVYICGPTGFIEHVLKSAKALGWPDSQLHLEYFGAKPIDTSHDEDFEVKVASTGRCYKVPADKSVAAVLIENGIDIPLSCEQGVCGTCITRILDGQPDHRDMYFTSDEKAKNDQFTPCCSRSKGKLLVLDI
ncbi:PDR/VanB family oxidoreductase [Methylibium sp. Root1272]|uniref:PDR/VanB family oxidoreductase n=1 Tax=Methylibium sp. Root1272 TaxID=1736441 RepID=UPI0006F9E576|nr:PDR/VanB family oxidoreductase [Methylibium sp. Root1272]KQW69899.1 Vanillate O-demethylase oxidoreductase [Methylibium sp. Root1272]